MPSKLDSEKDTALPFTDESAAVPSNGEAASPGVVSALPAFWDDNLSVAAAKELVQLAKDASVPVHSGADLPLADKAALLKKAARS
jgi:hypothetical protein